VCHAGSPLDLTGTLEGTVRDKAGVPQMGAVVHLYDRHENLVNKVLTNVEGDFHFASLLPDIYSVRVSLTTFVPAVKRNITIQPGVKSVLAINMASLLSSVELVYAAPSTGPLMSDEWKWVLRSNISTRPVLRMLPEVDMSDPRAPQSTRTEVFADMRGMVRVSSGESSSPFANVENQPDLGTSFALATSLFGRNQVQFSGNVGYGTSSETPAAGFRTSFSPGASGPEVKVTMQQVGVPLVGARSSSSAPTLRTLSISSVEHLDVTDDLSMDYGISLDSVTYLDRLHYFSPFARLRYRIGGNGELTTAYSSGAPPVELLGTAHETSDDLRHDLAALSVLPRVSLRNARAEVQRTENMEIGYTHRSGSRTYSVALYHEFVSNGAVTLSGTNSLYYDGDLLPELSSNSYVFNVGSYTRQGFMASATQTLGDRFSATVAYGRGGALTAGGERLETRSGDELRQRLRSAQRHFARGAVSGVAPVTGTRFTATYEWTDAPALTRGHVYLTSNLAPETGLNLRVRQPIPSWGPVPGRLEATAELRNMLAQGYLRMTGADGRPFILTQSPRALRGGVAFIF
jgi:hypothetical protein